MAYISFQPSDYFNPLLWTGTGSSNAITGLGFTPDMTWIKKRDGTTNNQVQDTVRSALTQGFTVYPNETTMQQEHGASITSWDSDGFTLGTDGPVNGNTDTFVGWSWKAGTTSGIAGSPSITPTSYSFNATSGFSVIAYTGNGTAGATIPHGLGVAPDMVIVKKLSSTSDWWVYHSKMDATAPEDYHLVLNTAAARVNNNGEWYDTAPTSTLVTLGANTTTNTATFIAYCFSFFCMS